MSRLPLSLRVALRTLGRHPSASGVVIATLALAIAANTVLFSLYDQILLRDLPVAEPDRLVVLDSPGPISGSINEVSNFSTPFSLPMLRDLAAKADVFDGLLARVTFAASLAVDGATARVTGELVSGNYFAVLGVAAQRGRTFSTDDDRDLGGHPVVVVSDAAWHRRFGGRDDVVGKTVRVNGQTMTVIGVAPAGFRGVQVGVGPEFWLPLAMRETAIPQWGRFDERNSYWLNGMARLRPGSTRAQAEARVAPLYRQLLAADLETYKAPEGKFRDRYLDKKLALLPGGKGRSDLRGDASGQLAVLAGMVGLVLAIAGAIVAALLAARATMRQREIAVRAALGAGRAQLVRQLALEAGLLAAAGGVLGVALARVGLPAVTRWLPNADSGALAARLDPRVLAFAGAATVVTALLCSLLPALQGTRPDLHNGLREAAGVGGSRRSLAARRTLVVAQVAFSLALLAIAGLFARSLARLGGIPSGLDLERVATLTVDPTLNGYAKADAGRFARELREKIGALPGVEHVTATDLAILADNRARSSITIDGYTPTPDEDMSPAYATVMPRYFATLGIRQLAGRDFTDADRAGSPGVAIVTRSFVERFLKNGEPLGRRFGIGRNRTPQDLEIVGVVEDSATQSLRTERGPQVYLAMAQRFDGDALSFYVRSAGEPRRLLPSLRRTVAALDPNLPVFDDRSLADQLGVQLFVDRTGTALAIGFALAAALLAALGLYGLLAFTVAQRTREIGLRMAVGAAAPRILRLVLGDVARLALVGGALGLALALAGARLVAARLYGVGTVDPLSLGAALGVLALLLLAAALLPARQAARLDPVEALRQE